MKVLRYILLITLCVFSFKGNSNGSADYQDSIAKILHSDISDSLKTSLFFKESKRLKNNNPYLALSYAASALGLAEKTNDSLLLGLINNRIGVIHLKLGNYNVAADFILKNYEIQQKTGDLRRQADALNNLGILFKKQKDYNTAKQYYLASHQLYKEIGQTRHLAAIYNNLGVIYKYLEQLDSSIFYYNLSLEQNKNTGNLKGLADNFVNLSNLYRIRKDTGQAQAYLKKSIKIQTSTNNVYGELTSLLQLSELHIIDSDFSTADSLLKGVQVRANKTGFKPLEASALFKLYELSKLKGDTISALIYLELNQAISDSLSSAEISNRTNNFNEQLIRVQQDLQNIEMIKINNLTYSILEKEKQNVLLLTIGLSILLLLSGILIFLFFKEKGTAKLAFKQSDLLQEQHKINLKNNANLLITISDLKEAKREEEALLALIVHDLKSPIGQIQSLIELLTSEIKPETLKKEDVRVYLKTMDLSFARMDELISSIINAHKSASDSKINTHLNSMMLNIIERSKFQAQSKKIAINTSLGEDFILKNKDPEKLKRVIENLVSNAIKFSKPVSEIRIKTELLSEGVIIEIGDHGPGFSKVGRLKLSDVIDDQAAIPTGAESSDKIGLKVVKTFCDELGIRVIINSEKKAGTTFQLYLTN